MIDWNKPVQTRDGQAVEIISTKCRGEYSVVGYIGDSDDLEIWTITGSLYGDGSTTEYDLINVPEKKVMYINVYGDGSSYVYPTGTRADTEACSGRIACVRVEYQEGQFDE